MKILSIDPGFYYFGWVLVDTDHPTEDVVYGVETIGNYGTIMKSRIYELKKIFKKLSPLVDAQKDCILIESQFKGHMKGLMIILLTLFSDYPNVYVIHPIHVKKYFNFTSRGYRKNKIESVEAASKLAPSVFQPFLQDQELSKSQRKEKSSTTNANTSVVQCHQHRVHDIADAYLQAMFHAFGHKTISNSILKEYYSRLNAETFIGLLRREKNHLKEKKQSHSHDETLSKDSDGESCSTSSVGDATTTNEFSQSDLPSGTAGAEL